MRPESKPDQGAMGMAIPGPASLEAYELAHVQHWSSCALHNAPAFAPGPCNCGGYKPAQDDTTLYATHGDDYC
jgi:hypothetical protein